MSKQDVTSVFLRFVWLLRSARVCSPKNYAIRVSFSIIFVSCIYVLVAHISAYQFIQVIFIRFEFLLIFWEMYICTHYNIYQTFQSPLVYNVHRKFSAWNNPSHLFSMLFSLILCSFMWLISYWSALPYIVSVISITIPIQYQISNHFFLLISTFILIDI